MKLPKSHWVIMTSCDYAAIRNHFALAAPCLNKISIWYFTEIQVLPKLVSKRHHTSTQSICQLFSSRPIILFMRVKISLFDFSFCDREWKRAKEFFLKKVIYFHFRFPTRLFVPAVKMSLRNSLCVFLEKFSWMRWNVPVVCEVLAVAEVHLHFCSWPPRPRPSFFVLVFFRACSRLPTRNHVASRAGVARHDTFPLEDLVSFFFSFFSSSPVHTKWTADVSLWCTANVLLYSMKNKRDESTGWFVAISIKWKTLKKKKEGIFKKTPLEEFSLLIFQDFFQKSILGKISWLFF